MADEAPPEVTELVYVPEPSWQPALIALGLGFLLAGLFMGWFFALVGVVLAVAGIAGWVRDAREFRERLPRRQEPTSAVIPATPLRRSAQRRG